ncbi:hypothetical protein EOPP23_13380 [Endozoicomonas sp. OPT23]|uniref:hypothetical protein n=1 Tax=Endozoicomonas sp. OPT23 TaxID=2072845 RepID=UPI00129B60A9|nr:hypothetical protein [Endozoicomonas sp. OPT23]MRI33982.1 hypothetical protein [Endozoicomonas sp. OPT23]
MKKNIHLCFALLIPLKSLAGVFACPEPEDIFFNHDMNTWEAPLKKGAPEYWEKFRSPMPFINIPSNPERKIFFEKALIEKNTIESFEEFNITCEYYYYESEDDIHYMFLSPWNFKITDIHNLLNNNEKTSSLYKEELTARYDHKISVLYKKLIDNSLDSKEAALAASQLKKMEDEKVKYIDEHEYIYDSSLHEMWDKNESLLSYTSPVFAYGLEEGNPASAWKDIKIGSQYFYCNKNTASACKMHTPEIATRIKLDATEPAVSRWLSDGSIRGIHMISSNLEETPLKYNGALTFFMDKKPDNLESTSITLTKGSSFPLSECSQIGSNLTDARELYIDLKVSELYSTGEPIISECTVFSGK